MSGKTVDDADVIVVGGGFGGGALATVLERSGLHCLVLERTTEFPDRTKGEWIAPWGVIEAQRLGLVDDITRARGHVIRRHISYDETKAPEEAEAATLELGMLPGVDGPMTQRHPDACQVLLDTAAAVGSDVRRGVDDVVVDPAGGPSVTYRDADGATRTARARLVVAADGRNSTVRRQLGIPLEKDRPHHLFSGLLVDGADGWPEDLQTAGAEGDVHFLAFPQGAGRVRLYLGFALDQRHRVSGPEGPAEFLRSFRLQCLPNAEALAGATPISPCATYPNEDAWVDRPVADGVVLIGDAAGWNDPITGQGLSIALRDVRVLSDILRSSGDWSTAALEPYVEERRERMRRLRFSAQVLSALAAEFGPEARARRVRAHQRMAEDPAMGLPLAVPMIGPDVPGPETFTEDLRQRLLA